MGNSNITGQRHAFLTPLNKQKDDDVLFSSIQNKNECDIKLNTPHKMMPRVFRVGRRKQMVNLHVQISWEKNQTLRFC